MPAGSLAALRIWVFGLWAMKILADPFQRLGWMPPEIFPARGLLRLIPHETWLWLIDPTRLLLIRVALVLALLLATVGVATRVAAPIAGLLLLYQQGLIRVGHFNHTELPLLYAALILAVAPCGDALAITGPRAPRPPGNRYAIPIVLIAAMLVTTYCFVGAHRLSHGGLELFKSNAMSFWVVADTYRTPELNWDIGVRVVSIPLLASALKYGFPLVTCLEVFAPLTLVWGTFRRFWIPAMIGFHISVLVLMKISFWEQVAVYAVFLDTSGWFQPVLADRAQSSTSTDSGASATGTPQV